MSTFDGLKTTNQQRNLAVSTNLARSEEPGSKLHKIVFPALELGVGAEGQKVDERFLPGYAGCDKQTHHLLFLV